MIPSELFTRPYLALLAEIFGVTDAPHGFILDNGSSGLMGTIQGLSAEVVSRTPAAEQATIAGHCGHVLFLLNFFLAFDRGENPQPDWPGSWATRTVDDGAWDALRGELRGAYETLVERVQAHETLAEPAVGALVMLIAHCAYHVGEIRQRLLWVGRDSENF